MPEHPDGAIPASDTVAVSADGQPRVVTVWHLCKTTGEWVGHALSDEYEVSGATEELTITTPLDFACCDLIGMITDGRWHQASRRKVPNHRQRGDV